MIEKLALLLVCILLFPTLVRLFRCIFLSIGGLVSFLLALFIPIRPCSCGEKQILVRDIGGEYSVKCQKCLKKTAWHSGLMGAKNEWSRIRGKKC